MFNELVGIAHSVQALSTLLKAASSLANYNEIVTIISEVNAKLIQANSTVLAAQEKIGLQDRRIQELELYLKELLDWRSEALAYESIEIANGVFSFVPRQREGKLQSTQKLCMNCFHENIKSVLQQSQEESRQYGLTCHRCKAKMIFRHYKDTT